MRRVNADFVQHPGPQEVQQPQAGALADARAHHGAGDAVVVKGCAGLVDNVHLEKALDPVRVSDGGLALHPRGHGGDVAHLQFVPPGAACRVMGKLGKQVDQAILQGKNALGDGRAQGDTGDRFGQRLVAVDHAGAVGRPVSFKNGLAMAHYQQCVRLSAQVFKRVQQTVGISIGDANRAGVRKLPLHYCWAMYSASWVR